MADISPWPIHAFDSLASTNATALEAVNGPAWVTARVQTAGRGRRARPWISPEGNLYATLLLHPSDPPAAMALRSFAAALALRGAILELTGASADLKWPNDVLLGGAKVAGILLEATRRGGLACLAIGFGVNLASAPARVVDGSSAPISLMAATGKSIAPLDFLAALSQAYRGWEDRFQTRGFAPLREEWLNHAARLGQVITARTGAASYEGVFDTVDDAGNLILITAQGRLAIPAADVFF